MTEYAGLQTHWLASGQWQGAGPYFTFVASVGRLLQLQVAEVEEVLLMEFLCCM